MGGLSVNGVVIKKGFCMSRRGENIYQRKDGLWEARYVKEIDVTGRKKYGSVYARSYREVKLKRQDALDNLLLNQKPVSLRNISLNELIEEWLYINKSRLKPSTYQRYLGFHNNHIANHLGNMKIIFVSHVMLRNYSNKLVESGLSPQTANAILIFLHSVMKYGHQQYNLPMPDFKYFQVFPKEMRVFSREEQQRLVEYLTKDMDIYKFGILIALFTGIRVGELCGLRWEDVEENCIKIRRTVLRLKKEDGNGTELYIGPPKTQQSVRIIPIMSLLFPFINGVADNGDKNEYVISSSIAPITEPRVMQYKFKRYLKNLEIEGATFHTLRHTFATRCIEAGVDVKSLSEILGHSNVQTTLNRYVHSSLSYKRANLEKLTSFFAANLP